MIEKSVGLIRNLYKKRKEIVELVTKYIEANDVIIIVNNADVYSVLGRTESDARTIHMLGVAIGSGFENAKSNDPALTLENYLQQPTTVALNYVERNGLA